MKPRNDRNGYRFVSFCKNGKYSKQFYVARLVAALFLSNPENKPQVNHKDGNPHNNKVENLEWCTASENIKHGYDTGLNPNKGETHYQAKLTEEQVKEIRVKYIPYKNSQYKLAKEYGVSRGCIYEIVSGINWKSI